MTFGNQCLLPYSPLCLEANANHPLVARDYDLYLDVPFDERRCWRVGEGILGEAGGGGRAECCECQGVCFQASRGVASA